MLENLKSNVLNGLRRQVTNLNASILERRDWLDLEHVIGEARPIFTHKYNPRSLDAQLRKDVITDNKLRTTESREELTVEAKRKIRVIRKELEAEIEAELAKTEEQFQLQFKTNEIFFNLSEEDYAAVLEDHNQGCISLERRMRSRANIDIENASDYCPRGEFKIDDRVRRERRDREEMIFYAGILREEKQALLKFEEYIEKLQAEEEPLPAPEIEDFECEWNDEYSSRLSAEEIEACRAEHIERTKKELDLKVSLFQANRERKERMTKARLTEPDPELHKKLIADYTLRMRAAEVQLTPSVDWGRVLRDLDIVFLQKRDWKEFIEHAVEYWTYLALPRKRGKFNSIISNYATLHLGPAKSIGLDAAFEREVEELRTERNNLLVEVRRLDELVLRTYNIMCCKQVRSRMGRIKITMSAASLVEKNYCSVEQAEAEEEAKTAPPPKRPAKIRDTLLFDPYKWYY